MLTNEGTTMADGATGETSAVRELHTALRDVRDGLVKARKLWKAAEEAADKCQVYPGVVLVVLPRIRNVMLYFVMNVGCRVRLDKWMVYSCSWCGTNNEYFIVS